VLVARFGPGRAATTETVVTTASTRTAATNKGNGLNGGSNLVTNNGGKIVRRSKSALGRVPHLLSITWADIVTHPDPEERRKHRLAGTGVRRQGLKLYRPSRRADVWPAGRISAGGSPRRPAPGRPATSIPADIRRASAASGPNRPLSEVR
jgi:hypothetical protein